MKIKNKNNRIGTNLNYAIFHACNEHSNDGVMNSFLLGQYRVYFILADTLFLWIFIWISIVWQYDHGYHKKHTTASNRLVKSSWSYGLIILLCVYINCISICWWYFDSVKPYVIILNFYWAVHLCWYVFISLSFFYLLGQVKCKINFLV